MTEDLGDKPRHSLERTNESAARIEFAYTPRPDAVPHIAHTTALGTRMGFLARLPGETTDKREGLLSIELVVRGRRGRRITVHLVGSGGHVPGDTPADAGSAETVGAALEQLSPIPWRRVSQRALTGLQRPLAARTVARLHISPPGDRHQDTEVYQLWFSTIERCLASAAAWSEVRLSFLALPVRHGPLKPKPLAGSPFGRLVPMEVDRRPDLMGVNRVDAAERYPFLVRVEVASEGRIARSFLDALLADIRGTGPASVELVQSGLAADVDARFMPVTLSEVADQGSGAWPADTARLNLREAACLLALPAGSVKGKAPGSRRSSTRRASEPVSLTLIESYLERHGWPHDAVATDGEGYVATAWTASTDQSFSMRIRPRPDRGIIHFVVERIAFMPGQSTPDDRRLAAQELLLDRNYGTLRLKWGRDRRDGEVSLAHAERIDHGLDYDSFRSLLQMIVDEVERVSAMLLEVLGHARP